ncbi:MAG: LacI family transcriptional regulator [Neomegalonema sp.]|nr:LacI family transcriptional regulator [Neomegalonema sp.]
MARRPTQREIAKRLGLSAATVSLAMRDSPMIASETKRVVREAVEKFGYVPNAAAAALRTGRTGIVGVSFHNVAHQFFAEVLGSIEDVLAPKGWAVFISNHREDPTRFTQFVSRLTAYGADGLIASPPAGADAAVLDDFVATGAPLVFAARYLRDYRADRAMLDDASALRQLISHLRGLGRERITMICGVPGTSVAEDRVRGFREQLSATGIEWREEAWMPGPPTAAGGFHLTAEALDQQPRPDALIAFNDLVATGALSQMYDRGLTPGREVALVGVGVTEAAELMRPRLTMTSNNSDAIGKQAAELLLRRLETPDAPIEEINVPSMLTVRESCGARS